jgi:hypothetical protein
MAGEEGGGEESDENIVYMSAYQRTKRERERGKRTHRKNERKKKKIKQTKLRVWHDMVAVIYF